MKSCSLYHNRSKTWNLDCAKAPGFNHRKWVHIANIDPFTMVESRKLSRWPKSKFLTDCGIIALLLLTIFAADLSAQLPLAWVDGAGDDANPCTRTAACKTFAGAISKTDAGGQISVLTPGSFGAVTIAKALTIDGNSLPADIIVAANNGITVTAGADDVVILRHIHLNGIANATSPGSGGAIGIQFNSGAQLIIEDCTFTGFTIAAININPTTAGNVVIRNVSISNCPIGVIIAGTMSPLNVSLNNVAIQNTEFAAVEASFGNVDIANSFITQNVVYGVLSESSGEVNCVNTLFASNGIAVEAGVGGTIRISNNDFFNNTTAISHVGGVVATANNNREAENGTVGSATTTIVYQ